MSDAFALPSWVDDYIEKVIGRTVIRDKTGKGDLIARLAAACSVAKGMLHGQPFFLLGAVCRPMGDFHQKSHNSIHLHVVKTLNDVKILHIDNDYSGMVHSFTPSKYGLCLRRRKSLAFFFDQSYMPSPATCPVLPVARPAFTRV